MIRLAVGICLYLSRLGLFLLHSSLTKFLVVSTSYVSSSRIYMRLSGKVAGIRIKIWNRYK